MTAAVCLLCSLQSSQCIQRREQNPGCVRYVALDSLAKCMMWWHLVANVRTAHLYVYCTFNIAVINISFYRGCLELYGQLFKSVTKKWLLEDKRPAQICNMLHVDSEAAALLGSQNEHFFTGVIEVPSSSFIVNGLCKNEGARVHVEWKWFLQCRSFLGVFLF